MQFKTLLFEQHGHIAILTLNRPHRGNSFGDGMGAELVNAWTEVKNNKDIWVAIVTGAGERHFCTGLDVKEAAQSSFGQKDRDRSYANVGLTAFHNQVWKPVITAVNGICAGGGLHFVADSDIVICSENAEFTDPHVSVGQVSALEPIGLTRRIPFEIVMRMVILGASERISAQKALALGMVSEVAPLDQLMPRALELAERVCECSPEAVWASKKAVWQGLEMGLTQACANGYKHLTDFWGHPDQVEGPRAFAEKRKPRWTVR